MQNKKRTNLEIENDLKEIHELIDEYIPDENRKEKIYKLLSDNIENVVLSPASGFSKFHSAFEGGWLYHTLNVMKNALKIDKLWSESGFGKNLYTKEELIFSALFHDLYKIGFSKDKGGMLYLKNNNKWKQEHYSQYYERSKLGNNMLPSEDATMMMLLQYGLIPSRNELIGIKLADGTFSESYKQYIPDYSDMLNLKTNIHMVIHQADFMSAIIENKIYNYKDEE